MQILVNLVNKNKNLDFYAAGDFLQTLFTEQSINTANKDLDLKTMDAHAMNIFKRITEYQYFKLTKCMRLPKAHVDFNNLIMKDIQLKYHIEAMTPSNQDLINKPLIFTHLATTTNNANGKVNADCVTSMIKILMQYDQSIIPDDIVIIMGRSNENEMFDHLLDTLKRLYIQMGKGSDGVCHMSTSGDGKRNSLDWESARGKTKLLSIHGDKGKGHKVVFFLGCTEYSIPRQAHVFKPTEIISESLLNVGLSRSTQYLFVGFTHSFPSRYLQKYKDKICDHAYIGWQDGSSSNTETIPEPYKEIIHFLRDSNAPNWTKDYQDKPTLTGNKSNLECKGDISKDFERAEDFISNNWEETMTKIDFGRRQLINGPFKEDHFMILGVMSEILIQRIIKKEDLFKILNKQNLSHSDNERFLCHMYDIRRFNQNEFDEYINKYARYFDSAENKNKNINLKQLIIKAFEKKYHIVHNVFNSDRFREDLAEFLSEKANNELRCECIWNVALFYNQLVQVWYQPVINTLFGFFNHDLAQLHQNIEKFVELYLKDERNIVCEKAINITAIFNQDQCKLLNLRKPEHSVSITGRLDIYNLDTNQLFEIKASGMDTCSQEWIIQTLCYACLLDIENLKVDYIYIVNVLQGCIWQWDIHQIINLPDIEDIIESKIKSRYDWHKMEADSLIMNVKSMRFEKLLNPSKRIRLENLYEAIAI
jgi:hypothetical protein